MIYPIVAYGHPTLKKVAEEIDQNYPELEKIIENMWETMYQSEGVGLAAPQVNLSIRLMVIDATAYEEEDPTAKDFKKVFINPIILEETGDSADFKEACLSVPGIAEYVSRKPKLVIEYYDENFELHEERYEGMIARIIQHEYDHLEGRLFVDRLSSLKKVVLRGRLKDISEGKVDVGYKMVFPRKKK